MLRRLVLVVLAVAFVCAANSLTFAQKPHDQKRTEKALEWWRDARFGLFIHWGLYAVPEGEWQGRQIEGLGEWIMNRAKIPAPEYEKLAGKFNPEKFNAEEIVKLAKDAGMKYIVITSKHHDGFAMYDSKASKYDMVDATPFKRDPLKELADACAKEGIKLGFYYSQFQDWHDPDAGGNNWDFPDEAKKDFAKYYKEKCEPQVREILTGYGPLVLIWFDTPRTLAKEYSVKLANLVHELQPDCLVSGRVGHGVGDYDSAGDNQISVGQRRRDWETPVTLNDTWGFKKNDNNWKPTSILIRQLAQVAGRDGNYLLNIGPKADGTVPQESIDRLRAVGKWMKANSDSIYGTTGNPFPYELPWGTITTKPGKLFLHVFNWPTDGKLTVYGIKSKVKKASLLANGTELVTKQKSDSALGHNELEIQLPSVAPDAHDSVIVLDIDGQPQIDTALTQQPDGSVTLPAFLGELHKPASGSRLQFDPRGVVEDWINKDDWLDWDFKLVKPGTYDVVVVTSEQKYGRGWQGDHKVTVDVAGQKLSETIDRDGKEVDPNNPYWPYVISKMGQVKLDKAGTLNVSLKPDELKQTKLPDTSGRQRDIGLTLVWVKLVPAN